MSGALITRQTRKAIPIASKRLIWNKYIGVRWGWGYCWCCRSATITCFDFEAGHVLAASRGGSDEIANLRPICSNCNKSMGATHMVEFQERIGVLPRGAVANAYEWVCGWIW
jgi:5-methylcytosine-specific restriction endonuclease McrA